MEFTLRREAETVTEKQRNRDFYPTNRTQAEHREMLRHTLPEQRSGRVKLVCVDCETRIGCTELIAKTRQRTADGKPAYKHRKCPT